MNVSTKIQQYLSDAEVSEDVHRALLDCWVAVTNAGGAAGFPFPPVDPDDVAPVLNRLVGELHVDRCRLLATVDDQGLLGWLVLRRNVEPLVAHWGSLHHVQSRPNHRGEGVGSFLMHQAREIAREEMGLEQLHLAARAGMGLETFYGRLGWCEIGRWPGALRLAPDDDRDEILMHLGPL